MHKILKTETIHINEKRCEDNVVQIDLINSRHFDLLKTFAENNPKSVRIMDKKIFMNIKTYFTLVFGIDLAKEHFIPNKKNSNMSLHLVKKLKGIW